MFTRTYQLAGITFSIEADSPILAFPAHYFEQFAATTTLPDVVCRVRGVPSAALTLDPLDDEQRAYLATGLRIPPANFSHPLLNALEVRTILNRIWDHLQEVTVVFDPLSLTVCDLYCRTLNIFYVHVPANSAVERHIGTGLFTPFLPQFSAAMFHSSSVCRGDRVAVFLAPDGGGKTTSATLAPEETILCDDQNIVRREEGRWMVYGTPWGRYMNSQMNGPLGGLFMLEKAGHFELTPVTPLDGLRGLWQEHSGYYELIPPEMRLQAVMFLQHLCHEIPLYRLRFPKNCLDWGAVDAVMSAPAAVR